MLDTSFNDEEGRRILARASERQEEAERARLDSGESLTLEDLTAIGEEVGIDASHVRAAAGELVLQRDSGPVVTTMGVPKEISEIRVLPGTVSDRQWAQMVGILRETFRRDGIVSQVGDLREWTDSHDATMPIKVRLEPLEEGTLVTLAQSTRGFTRDGPILSAGLAVAAAALSVLLLLGDFEPGAWGLPSIFVALSGSSVLATAFGGRAFVSRRRRVLDSVADKLELIGRPQDT